MFAARHRHLFHRASYRRLIVSSLQKTRPRIYRNMTGSLNHKLSIGHIYGWIMASVSCAVPLMFSVPETLLFVIAVATATAPSLIPAKAKYSLRTLDSVRHIDIAILVFYISSCISTVFAYDVTTALPAINLRTLFVLLYFALRWLEGPEVVLIAPLAVGMIVHCIEGIVHFVRSYSVWLLLQFRSLSDFRSTVTLTSPGVRPGNHAAIYIVTVAASMYGIRSRNIQSSVAMYICHICLVISFACVAISLSRGLYLCVVVLLAIAGWSIWNAIRDHAKLILAIVGIASITLAVMLVCVRPIVIAMSDTMRLVSRLSQVRSADGRFVINVTALHMALHSGWIGTGLDNYALAARHRHLLNASYVTAHSFNVALQVGVEQGLVGITSLLVLIVAGGQMLWKIRTRPECHSLIGGGAALLLFGLTQSFIIADQETAVSLAVFSALVTRVSA